MAEDKPAVKNISRKKAQEVAKRAKSRAEELRKQEEYPKKLADFSANAETLQIEVAQLQDQAASDLPPAQLIQTHDKLAVKAEELAETLAEMKKIKKKMED